MKAERGGCPLGAIRVFAVRGPIPIYICVNVYVARRAAYDDGRRFCTRAFRDKTVAEVSPERDTVRAPRYVSAAASPRAIRMRARSRRSDRARPRARPGPRRADRQRDDDNATPDRTRRVGLGERGASGRRRLRPLSRDNRATHAPGGHRPAVIARRQRRTVLPFFRCIQYMITYYNMYCTRLPFTRRVYVFQLLCILYCNIYMYI